MKVEEGWRERESIKRGAGRGGAELDGYTPASASRPSVGAPCTGNDDGPPRGCFWWPIHPPILSPQGFARSRGFRLALLTSRPFLRRRRRTRSRSGSRWLPFQFHLLRLVRGWGSFSPALACFEELPASLAATATSEGDCDQDHDEFQHGSPHRLGVRFRLSFLVLTRALTGTG